MRRVFFGDPLAEVMLSLTNMFVQRPCDEGAEEFFLYGKRHSGLGYRKSVRYAILRSLLEPSPYFLHPFRMILVGWLFAPIRVTV